MATDPWAAFPDATPTPPATPKRPTLTVRKPAADPWAEFPDADPAPNVSPPAGPVPGGPLVPTGQVHDGDTFRLSSGANARLYGADAFELDQTGRNRSGAVVPLGEQSRAALVPFAIPGGVVTPTGAVTYGRPVASLEAGGQDAASSLLHDGLAVTTPRYLQSDQARFQDYTQQERGARLNQRGAFAGTFQTPEDYRHGKPDPWATSIPGSVGDGNSQAVFWDDPTPFQGLKPEVEWGYAALFQDMSSTPDDLLAYAKANGFTLDPAAVRERYEQRNKAGKAGGKVEYTAPPRVLTDPKDGTVGAALRGFGDPLNLLDEAGAVVDSLLPGGERENVWGSDRRFGDVYANNLEQNRSILDHDNAEHWWARFGGQLASGIALPGASVEGVGLNAASAALRGGASRYAAEQAARRAFVTRLGAAGAIEGGVAGAGNGEDLQGRVTGAAIGAPLGGALAVGAGVLAPRLADLAGKPFSRLTGRTGDNAAEDFADGAVDTGKALTSNDLNPPVPRVADAFDLGAVPGGPVRMRDRVDGATPTAGALGSTPDDFAIAADIQQKFPVGANGTATIKGKGGEDYTLNYTVKPDVSGRTNFGDTAHERMIDVTVTDANGKEVESTYFQQNGATTPDYQFEHGGSPAVFENHPFVEEGFRRKGIHSAVVDWFENTSGYAVRPSSPKETNGASDFWKARDDRTSAAMAADLDTPTLYGPAADDVAAPGSLSNLAGLRPLTADATSAERLAAAERLQPRDVLPLPSNAVDGLDEAARIERGRFDPVRAPNEAKALEPRSIPHARTGNPVSVRGPLDLSSWLRMEGGLRPVAGELEHLGITNAPRKGLEMTGGDRLGPLVNKEGMSYDDAAERAWEAGFFPEYAERPTISEFLDALDATHSGRSRVFRPDDLPEVDAYYGAQQQRVDVERAQDAGAPLTNDRAEPVGLDDLDRNAPPVAAYEEWGENAPNLAGNIRLDKLNSPQEIKRALLQTERVTGGFDAARRGRITQAETANLASELGMTPDDLLARRKGQAFNAEEALAARQILARSATDLVNLARRVRRTDNAGDELESAFREAWLRHVAIQEQVSGATAEAGRVLSQFRMAADSTAVGRVLPTLGNVAGGSGRVQDAARMIVDSADDPAKLNTNIARALKPRFRDKLTELYYNSLLSGPQTHAVNILSNTITALGQLPEHAVAAGVGAARKALPGQAATDRVLFSEVGARAVGLMQGTREGLRQGLRTFVTGEPADAVTKVEQQTQHAIGGKVGSVIRTPTRALAAEDELFKAMARRMELTGLATRQAYKEGLKGSAATKRVADILQNPSDEMLAQSFEYGRYLTFQNPLGIVGQKVSEITDAAPALKLILPFVRTPTNILKFALERSPAAPVLKEWRQDIASGGARRDLAIAKVLVGSGISALVVQLAGEGKLTGGGPADDNAKRLLQADGWQPYSLKVGDKYYSYSRLDPYALVIGTAADIVDQQAYMTDKQREEKALTVFTAIAKNLSNKTWLSGLSSAIEAINDPDRSLGSFARRTAGAIAVPALAAQIARSIDPVSRDPRSIGDAIRVRLPGASDGVAARRDVFGREVKVPEGLGPNLLSPIPTMDAKNDPVVRALLEVDATVSKPARSGLSPEEYDRYQQLAGTTAYNDLRVAIGGPVWSTLNAEDRKEGAEKIVNAARRSAREALGISLSKKKGAAVSIPGGVPAMPAADPWAAFPDAR